MEAKLENICLKSVCKMPTNTMKDCLYDWYNSGDRSKHSLEGFTFGLILVNQVGELRAKLAEAERKLNGGS